MEAKRLAGPEVAIAMTEEELRVLRRAAKIRLNEVDVVRESWEVEPLLNFLDATSYLVDQKGDRK